MADKAYSSGAELAKDEGVATPDFSKVQTIKPGETPTGQYYKYATAQGGYAADTVYGKAAPDATPASLGLTAPVDPNQSAEDAAASAGSGGYMNPDGTVGKPPDQNQIYSDTIKNFQAEIDALDTAAATARGNITTQYNQTGTARLGANRAILANAGMLGQVSGQASEDNVVAANTQELDAAVAASDAKYQDQKNALLGTARTMSADAYNAKLAAYSAGANATVQYLKDKTTAAQTNAATLAKQALSKGIDVTDPKYKDDLAALAKTIGVSPDSIVTAYTDAKSERDAAAAKAKQDASFTLSSGQVRYDANGNPVAVAPTADKFSAAKDAAGNPITFDSTTGKYLDSTGKPIDPTQVDSTTIGTDPASVKSFLQGRPDSASTALAAIPDTEKGSVMQLVSGDALLSDIVKSRGIQGTAAINNLINEAMSIDPTFSVNANKQRYAFKTSWNDPNAKAYTTRTSINTASGHLADLKTTLDQLQGTNFKIVNGVVQSLDKNIGNSQAGLIAQANDTIGLLATEIAKAYAGGVPNQDEVTQQMNGINASNPTAVNDAIINNKATLLNSLLGSTAQEYKQVMGSFPSDPILHNQSLDAMQAAGINTQGITKTLIQQGMKASSLNDYIAAFPDKASTAKQILQENPSLSDDEILQVLQPDFSSVGADTNSGSSSQPLIGPPKPLSYTPLQKTNLSAAPQNIEASVQLGKGAAVANNNPGNLRNVDGSWMKFNTPEEGFQALMGYVQRAKTGQHSAYSPTDTLATFFSHYAPAADSNDPKSYAAAVAKGLGISVNTQIKDVDTFGLAQQIALHDSSSKVTRLA